MKAAQGNVYGYVYSKKTVFRYNKNLSQPDAFLTGNKLPFEIVTRLELDTSTHTLYIFDNSGEKIIPYNTNSKEIISPTPNNYLLARFDTTKKVSELKLKNFNAPALDSTLFAFPRFDDGGLSADGFYTKNSHHLFYVPFYNGGIIRYNEADNNIKLIHTIDNTPPSNIAVLSGNIYNRSSKSVIVNSTAAADDQYLYVLSYVLSQDVVTNNYKGPVVDVYAIESGRYEGSFRFPGYQGKPVLQLAKCTDTLIAAYENNILFFKLNVK